MPYFIILPDGTTGTNQWAKSDAGETEEALVQSNDDDTSKIGVGFSE